MSSETKSMALQKIDSAYTENPKKKKMSSQAKSATLNKIDSAYPENKLFLKEKNDLKIISHHKVEMMNTPKYNVYGFTWFGAKSQNDLIPIAESKNKKVVKMVYNGTHMWTIMTAEKLLELTKRATTFVSEILHSYPKKVYFDVDVKKEDDEDFFTNFKLEHIKQVINDYFDEDTKMAISGSIEEGKKSYHIVLPDYILENDIDLNNFKRLVKLMSRDNKAFDTAVYTKNRQMKCIRQKKSIDRAPQAIIEDDNEHNHFICSFFTGREFPFTYEFDEEETKYDFSATVLHKMAKQQKEQTVPCEQLTLPKLNPCDLNDMKYLLSLLPVSEDHAYTWKAFLAYFYNGFTFDEFWDWASKKHDTAERFSKYKRYWSNEEATKKNKQWAMGRTGVLKLLGHFYKELKNVEDITGYLTNIFMDSFKLKYHTIDGRIEHKHYTVDDKKALVFNLPMGSGKTSETIAELKRNYSDFIWITPRITLANNTLGACESAGLFYVLNYKNVGNVMDKIEKYNKATKLIIQAESLHYVNPKKTNKYFIVVDEIETVLNNWNSGETHGDNMKRNFTVFVELIKGADKIIFLDAFTTQKTIRFLQSIGVNDIQVYNSTYKPPQRKINFRIASKRDEWEPVLKNICKDLDEGKKIYLFYPYKNPSKNHLSIAGIKEYLLAHCSNKSIKITEPHTGDSTEKQKAQLTNANEYWSQFDCVITNTAITVGVNFDTKDYFDKIYMFCSSRCNLPRDLLQASMRPRHIKDNKIEMICFDTESRKVFEVADYYMTGKNDIYNALIDDIKVEYMSDWKESLNMFCSKCNYEIEDNQPENILEKAFEKLFSGSESNRVDFAFNDIEDLTDEHVFCLYQRIASRDIEAYEMVQLKKYNFVKKFRSLCEADKIYIWNKRLESTFDKIRQNDELIHMICTDNGKSDIRDIDWSRYKASAETTHYLTTRFSCILKSPIMRIVKTLNENLQIEFVVNTAKKGDKSSNYKLSKRALKLLEICDSFKTPTSEIVEFFDDEDIAEEEL